MKKLKVFFLKHFEGSLIFIIFLGVLAIAFLVNYKFAFLNFFFLPVIMAGYFLGKKQAVLTALLCVLVVVFYLLFTSRVTGGREISFDDIIDLTTWGGFLILTGGIVGSAAEQKEAKIRNLRRAYIGVLDIMLKYLELADRDKPRSLRVCHLAGSIAENLKLPRRDIENIKTAALLIDAGDLKTSLPFFEEVGDFMKGEIGGAQNQLSDKERVLLQTTASLLKDVGPILSAYMRHYVDEASVLDKALDSIPFSSSIVALAELYDRIPMRSAAADLSEKLYSMMDIEKLAGRSFPTSAVQALRQVVITTG